MGTSVIEFRRTPTRDWETWPATAIQKPPVRENAPFTQCNHEHGSCVTWQSVHFYAIRFNGLEWRADTGWQR